MPALLCLFFVGALCAPIVLRKGRGGFAILALIPGIAFVWSLGHIPGAFRGGEYIEHYSWIPQLGLTFDVRIDALSAVMSLLVSGVGALVLMYSSRYFRAGAPHLGRFAGVFLAFAGAMFGLVTTDNTLAMYTFWELTTVFSFLLIGHYSDRGSSRLAARQAITVTTAGGLAMLAGIIMFGVMPGGSFSFAALVASSQAGTLGGGNSTLIASAAILMLVGAFSKSALFPFHFWLPAAMAAPTPVSAYLHAAAMVKAGVYLVARLAPGFAYLTQWKILVAIAGISTLIIGGYRALKQNDLKLILAFGTVSQLGLITLMVGYGDAQMALAGLMLLCAHALFKSTLFLTVGIVDVWFGTRDLRELSGVARLMPDIAVLAGVAVASMIGFPPLGAFIAKEAALEALIGGDVRATITWVAIAIGSALTVAYGLRFWWGAFVSKPSVPCKQVRKGSVLTAIPIYVLSAATLALGIGASAWSPILENYAGTYPGEHSHLAIWHGFGAPLLVTVVVLLLGALLFAIRGPFEALANRHTFPLRADGIYADSIDGLEALSTVVTRSTQRGSLPAYLSTIFTFTLVAVSATAVLAGAAVPESIRPWDSPGQAAVVAVTILAAFLAARSRHRMKAVLLMGITGYGVALIYELYGAPDLALTQVLSETGTLVIFVLVLRRFPAYFSNRPLRASRWWRLTLAVLVGLAVSVLAAFAAGVRIHEPIWKLFPDEAYAFGYGKNIVNVTLVDIRAWDTLGETSVLVVCAIGIASLLFVRDSQGRLDRLRNVLGPVDSALRARLQQATSPEAIQSRFRDFASKRENPTPWLATVVQRGADSVPVILAVGTRLVFYSIVVVSFFFLFSGHNAPGGGFAGGLLAGIALALRYLAGGRFELGAALPLLPAHLMGGGMILATAYVFLPVFFGGLPMQTVLFDFSLPAFGDVHFATALVFDIGVYIAVVGLMLEVLRSLGGEIDRHGEIEGLEPPEFDLVAHNDERRNSLDCAQMNELLQPEVEEEVSSAHGDENLMPAHSTGKEEK
ncbi:Na+/H+ antiporter subunit A [Arcanobacterium haemolyticum]|nr:Na+/H+ antiporter subunit A [Arcanobacterium haemolyticum]